MAHVARVNPCVPSHYNLSYFYRGFGALLTCYVYHPYDVTHFCPEVDGNVVEGFGILLDVNRGQRSRDEGETPRVVGK